GAVANPDVYTLPPESTIKDAVQAAGGPTEKADLNRINLAQRVHDEEHIYVPEVGEERLPVTSQPSSPGRVGGKVNINTATAEELETLPGIGPAFAQRIIEYRQEKGPFASIEDIEKVKGIGEATFEKLRDLITVD
ncbi:MAG: helix-hairpin-helix domain-containing protein, partial [Chloroflexota bacterium]|nr:helix-hairpin-helix domain-containing protein [Chloroflexota bacterium]